MTDEDIQDDVDFDPEDELGATGSLQAKIKKLRDELAAAKAQRQEYLDGWQRCKADAANAKQEARAAETRAIERVRESLIADIVPVLDSFDMASGNESWDRVDEGWRSGIEYIRNQLLDVLEKNGVKRFGKIGDAFSPYVHEAVQETDEGAGEPHSVVRVLRAGYSIGDRVIRPAQVIIKSAPREDE
jgi:molecular chaperone GrpE